MMDEGRWTRDEVDLEAEPAASSGYSSGPRCCSSNEGPEPGRRTARALDSAGWYTASRGARL